MKSYTNEEIREFIRQNPVYLNGHYQMGADKFGVGRSRFEHQARALRRMGYTKDNIKDTLIEDQPSNLQNINISPLNTLFKQKGDNAEVESNRIKSLEALLEIAEVDLSIWEVERHVINKWDVTNSAGIAYENWQVKAWMKKIKEGGIDYRKMGEALIEKMQAHSPTYKPYTRYVIGKHLLVIDPADCHMGKYASKYETNEEYNMEIAKQRVRDGILGIIEKARPFNIDKILLPLGNDWLHIDNPKSTTTSGTYQNSDGMLYDMYLNLYDVFVEVIDTILEEFDIDIEFNPSNHDWMSGWMFMKTLEAHYRTCSNIKFNTTMNHRKYYIYGSNLIATSHGDGAKMADMPLLMAQEAPEMWAESKFRYVYLHHIHHKQVTKFLSGKDYIGVTVEYLRSPSSSDSWHHRNGYVGAKKAIEGFLHHKYDGQVARLTHYFE